VDVTEEHRILFLEYFGSSKSQEGWSVKDIMVEIG
jgi:hypothetical protein